MLKSRFSSPLEQLELELGERVEEELVVDRLSVGIKHQLNDEVFPEHALTGNAFRIFKHSNGSRFRVIEYTVQVYSSTGVLFSELGVHC